MLKRHPKLRFFAETICEEIKLAPDESKEARYEAWVTEKLATPRFCTKHPSTKLVYGGHNQGDISQAYGEYSYGRLPQPRPGFFEFSATLRCPACCCCDAQCPPEFHATNFATFATATPQLTEAVARCREFVAQVNTHDCGFAAFVGLPGTGKTRLACNIIAELENGDALYVRQGQLTTALRATYGRKDVFLHGRGQRNDDGEVGDAKSSTPLEIVQGVRFLVLDEIGCAPLANDERLLLDELLKHRYDERKPTILISNLALDQLKEFLGHALTDRIKHASGNGKFILQFKGDSYRRTTGEGDYLGASHSSAALPSAVGASAAVSSPKQQ